MSSRRSNLALALVPVLLVAACAPAARTTNPAAAPLPLAYTKVLVGVTDIAQAEAKVTAALKAQGFGVVTRIDLQATMKEKLGKDLRPYLILGACNPGFALRAIEHDPVIGLLLPCKVIVYQRADGALVVSFARPSTMLSLARVSGLADLAAEVDGRFQRAFASL